VRILGFGTYDGAKQPRVAVLLQGLEDLGCEVTELNRPLGFSTDERVEMLHKPWLVLRLVVRLAAKWAALSVQRLRLPRPGPDVVLVGYLAQFDVILARVLFPRAVIALDLLVFADDTAQDRGVKVGSRTRLLRWLDRAAMKAATVIVVDTEENEALVPPDHRRKVAVAPVGALHDWFIPPASERVDGPLRAIFFGLFTPLQGAPVIGAAIAALPSDLSIEVTMVGSGQDFAETRSRVGDDPRVTWLHWVPSDDLPRIVARHDVCLGIFGESPKALRVVPTKVYQGSAAGCAIVTSGTAPQRRALGAAATFVPPGDPEALSNALVRLVEAPADVRRLRESAHDLATRSFRPMDVAQPVLVALQGRARQGVS
jgi:glycosyltransferase involved in cell wall biosynthesis